MAWKKFPYPHSAYLYSATNLKKVWPRLHTGDAELFPNDEALIQAWIAYHSGEFEKAAQLGLEAGLAGYSVANKATCIYANYLEESEVNKLKLYETVSARCDKQKKAHPTEASAYYWQAYALGRYSQGVSILAALAEGIGTKVKNDLDTTIRLAPKHADAHIALGVYHAEIIDKVGAMVGGITYGASKNESILHFKKALELNPDSAIARIEYANGLVKLEGKKKMEDALDLYREAAAFQAKDAMERLDVQLAIDELKD